MCKKDLKHIDFQEAPKAQRCLIFHILKVKVVYISFKEKTEIFTAELREPSRQIFNFFVISLFLHINGVWYVDITVCKSQRRATAARATAGGKRAEVGEG